MRPRRIAWVGMLLMAVSACAVPTTSTPVSEAEIATRVAGTMTAVAGATEPGSPAVPHGAATVEPLPTPEPLLRIAYTDGNNVWFYQAGMAPRQVTTSGGVYGVRLSDDGAWVAFLRRETGSDHGELRAVRTDGSGETVLLTPAALDAFYPPAPHVIGTDVSSMDFIAGTHTLVFNTYAIPEVIGLMNHDDLWAIDVDSGILTSLLPAGSGGDFAISPDGAQIVVVRPDSISLIDVDGSNLRPGLLTFPHVITYSEFLYYPPAVWAADSSAVGFLIPSEDPLGASVSGSVWRIPANGGAPVRLGTINGDCYFPSFGGPLIAPDLARVAFTRPTGTPNVETLFITNADGSGEMSYATGDVEWEGWSPDGMHFAYRLDGPMNLYLGTVGAAPSSLPSGMSLEWVNAAQYLYLTGSGTSWTLMLGSTSGISIPLASLSSPSMAFDFIE